MLKAARNVFCTQWLYKCIHIVPVHMNVSTEMIESVATQCDSPQKMCQSVKKKCIHTNSEWTKKRRTDWKKKKKSSRATKVKLLVFFVSLSLRFSNTQVHSVFEFELRSAIEPLSSMLWPLLMFAACSVSVWWFTMLSFFTASCYSYQFCFPSESLHQMYIAYARALWVTWLYQFFFPSTFSSSLLSFFLHSLSTCRCCLFRFFFRCVFHRVLPCVFSHNRTSYYYKIIFVLVIDFHFRFYCITSCWITQIDFPFNARIQQNLYIYIQKCV